MSSLIAVASEYFKHCQIKKGNKGKSNIKCLRKVSGHYEPPEKFQCTLEEILQLSGTVMVFM